MIDNYTDEDLVSQYIEGDETIFEKLVEKYKPLMINRIKKCHIDSMDFDDLLQECKIVLYQALNKYSAGKNTKFSSFYIYLLQHRICELYRYNNASKRKGDVYTFSELDKDDYIFEVYEGMAYSKSLNPLDIVEVREDFETAYNGLNETEKEEFIKYIQSGHRNSSKNYCLYRSNYKLKRDFSSKKCE